MLYSGMKNSLNSFNDLSEGDHVMLHDGREAFVVVWEGNGVWLETKEGDSIWEDEIKSLTRW